MFVVSPEPIAANTVVAAGSPFWLRLFGEWVQLEGVVPDTSAGVSRSRSSFESVDGVQWEQQAPAHRRSWSLEIPWQSRVATRVLEVAAHTNEDVWLLDRTRAVVNMLRPGDCYGDGTALLADGMPLRRFTAERTVTSPVRRGVGTFVGVWTDAAAGTPVATVSWPGGSQVLTAPAGTVAQRASVGFTPEAHGDVAIVAAAGTTGLQVTEDWLPDEWMAGQGVPCRVVVDDPSGTLHRMNQRSQALGTWSVELREVGA